MSVLNVTDGAVKELKKSKEENGIENAVVRIGIEGGGCSGFNYKLNFDEPENVDLEKDERFEQGGLKFVVDKKSALYIAGTTLDWYEDLSKRGFSFNNPNATKSCGCGSSFSV